MQVKHISKYHFSVVLSAIRTCEYTRDSSIIHDEI